MKKSKSLRILSLLIALIMTLSLLVSCNDTEETEAKTDSDPVQTSESEEKSEGEDTTETEDERKTDTESVSDTETETEKKAVEEDTTATSSDSIVELNKDLEPYIIAAASQRGSNFHDPHEPLVFVHLSDVHAVKENWNRMVEFVNHYSEYISFGIHTGDYCGANQGEYVDMYKDGDKCDVPIFNVVGNHDTMPVGSSSQETASKKSVYDLLFGTQCKEWGVTFMDSEYPTVYYRDFPKSNIRVIVLDLYNEIDEQKVWLKDRLDEAKEKGMHVVTAMHEMSSNISEPLDTAFHTLNDEMSTGSTPFERIIEEFVQSGGIHIVNLAGHKHRDFIGNTISGIFNISIDCATGEFTGNSDGPRVKGTRNYDSFNLVSIDTDIGVIKLIRIGNNLDTCLREKKVLSYDYINKKLLAGGNQSGGAAASTGDSSGASSSTQVEVPESVNKYISARNFVAHRPKGSVVQIVDKGLMKDSDGTEYNRFVSQSGVPAGELFYTRLLLQSDGTCPVSKINPIEVGTAKYLVIKMRGECYNQSIHFRLSTIVGEATVENIGNSHDGVLGFPMEELDPDSWTTYVLPIEEVMPDAWVADSDGNYTVSVFTFTMNDYTNKFAIESRIDFAYFAFVDDWSEIEELVDCDTVRVITMDYKTEAYNPDGTKQ